MNLTIDIGNSSAKAALFERGRLVRVFRSEELRVKSEELTKGVEGVIMVSTRGETGELEHFFRERVGRFLKLDHTTPVPIKNLYATPETLGYDRLAAAVGAWAMFPGQAALICDFGTAITYDIVSAAGEFLGGSISPGAGSRFRALHDYTGTLPLYTLPKLPPRQASPATPPSQGGEFARGKLSSSWKEEYPEPQASGEVVGYFPARDTKTAIENGVVAGIVAETEACIEAAKRNFYEIKIIFTGGDAEYFAERVKSPIFATSDLIFYGLNAILEYNGASRTGE